MNLAMLCVSCLVFLLHQMDRTMFHLQNMSSGSLRAS